MKFLQTDCIEITKEAHLPLSLFHYKFNKTKQVNEINTHRKEFQERFWSIIWCCYRKNFKPLLSSDQEALKKAFEIREPKRVVRLGYTNDSGWGCVIRVA